MAVVNATNSNFRTEILESDVTVLVDFWAPWCGPCRMVSPIVDEIAEETPSIKVCKVNIDEQPALATQFGVMSIPTLMVFRGGEIVGKAVGARNKEFILKMLKV
jgi:thioredoxin 1